MTLEERIEANANRVLWCVHVLGADDLYAEPSHAAAVARAEELNKAIWSRESAPDDILCFAYADMWPWSAEQHAKAMKEEAEQEEKRRAAIAAKA